MEYEILKNIKQEHCDKCTHKDECHIPCPNVLREILNLNKNETL